MFKGTTYIWVLFILACIGSGLARDHTMVGLGSALVVVSIALFLIAFVRWLGD